jgi:hypothetical protein
MSIKIPCLSVYQPWAELLVAGIKPVENRTQRSHHRGPLLVHASKKFDTDWDRKLPPDKLAVAKEHLKTVSRLPSKLPRGCIVGITIQTGCADPGERVDGWHESDAFGLEMRGAVKFQTPIPYIGRQGIFKADVQGKIGPGDIIKIVTAIREWKKCLVTA